MLQLKEWEQQLGRLLQEFQQQAGLQKGQIVVIGCSTSEIAGEKIGTAGTLEIAEMVYRQLQAFADEYGLYLAFQCCEHLNRALVVDREQIQRLQLEEVAVVPVRQAGGSMATYAFNEKKDSAVVEFIKADAGIDIGDTFIGMHLKHVAVPLRTSVKEVGHAHVTMARTRPKLIGGARAVYEKTNANEKCSG
ncbi:TIGR01440 family protein [Bacillus sp. PK3_68]|uniref:TIGR01440 family protein n=1 Tax=Bacillaceae TaxID=186817 RepID=UPI000E75CAEC|nr:TIGR01440 family protein [Bacillus sp. PK3_68]RJS60730.1 TIGR01440 family protein [Bacillus sp. PK3_68]